MRQRYRLALLALTALVLAPGTFVRTIPPPPDYASPVTVTKLRVEPLQTGLLTLESAWQLTSRNDYFGGYSALVDRGDGTFLSASDAGRMMVLPRPDQSDVAPRLDTLLQIAASEKRRTDVESLAIDPQTSTVWAGLEQRDAIIRFSPKLREERRVRPPEMRPWEANAGAESLVRLKDGRFIVIAEETHGEGRHEALLFGEDPTLGKRPIAFTFIAAEGWRPSDATLLPDGRILVVMRKLLFQWPPKFEVKLAIADPAGIRPGDALQSTTIAHIAEPLPSDNFEGATVTIEPNGDWAIWLISDDNFFRLQRTLLLKLIWPQSRHDAGYDKRRPE